MAPGTRSQRLADFDVHHDYPTKTVKTFTQQFETTPDQTSKLAALHELHVNHVGTPSKPGVDPLVTGLERFHLHSSAKENVCDKTKIRSPDHKSLLQSGKRGLESFPCASDPHRSTEDSFATTSTVEDLGHELLEGSAKHHHSLAIEGRQRPSNQKQLAKHNAGQFEWVLEVPASSDAFKNRITCQSHQPDSKRQAKEEKLYFGCNLLNQQPCKWEAPHQDQSANTYTLIATRISGDEKTALAEVDQKAEMSATQVLDTDVETESSFIRMAELVGGHARRSSETALSAKHGDIIEQIISLPPANPKSRIEDSVEALDKLEDELEALHAVTEISPVLSPETQRMPSSRMEPALGRTNSVRKIPLKTGSSTVRSKGVERAPSIRKSTSMTLHEEGGEKTNVTPLARKPIITRPASLLPPKPLAKSSKPVTRPTFELPGEAVARQLKEQREARMSQQFSKESAPVVAAPSPSKSLVKSTKPPTRPNFELPGEAISRRKREEREARLKAQEEEERKRREFKARPVRTSIAPNNFPRETITSRARQNKMNGGAADPSPAVNKRYSHTISTTSSRPSLAPPLSSDSQTRGRPSIAGSPSAGTVERATSTSTASINGGSLSKRSTISVEEVQQQKQRAREIYQRDNSFTVDRERERREREAAAKLARQEAAERSRQLSREWAEKQKLRLKKKLGMLSTSAEMSA